MSWDKVCVERFRLGGREAGNRKQDPVAKQGSYQLDGGGRADDSAHTDFLGEKGLVDLHRLLPSSHLLLQPSSSWSLST